MDLYERYPQLAGQKENIARAIDTVVAAHRAGGRILLAGNGGSSADCTHIAGELTKSFLLPRPVDEEMRKALCAAGKEGKELSRSLQGGIAAFDLTSQQGPLSAFANDVSGTDVYAQLVYACGRRGDVFIGISTSGNSANVVRALITARAAGLKTVALTGEKESRCSAVADVTIRVPETETYKIQELHLPVYHFICAEAERIIFGKNA